MQSNDSLKELNAKLLTEITELRKENAEIPKLREKSLKFEAENGELKAINAEIPDLKRKISKFDAERGELKRRIVEALSMTEEKRTRRDAENAKLKARIEELEFEFRDRITKVKQKQTLNDNSSNNSSSNFNLVADQVPTATHHEKPLVDTSLLEDKETDAFLYEVHKKKVSNEIRQRNWEPKLKERNFKSKSPFQHIPKRKCLKISTRLLIHAIARHQKKRYVANWIQSARRGRALQHLALLYNKAFNAEDGANRANQEEILCWCSMRRISEVSSMGL
ncbi:hypothetical protein GLOIN_2v1495260 [Rhizophagus clarus]|uniref:Uncharacterized protein n=1 Tax=Rhizophagus clarus TaxID=94130 RepID=A0A8H3MDH0_9GLOM|nr:hypothetical protein GLOIN_2v1495260 [Rhizophagus clarus]